MATNAGLFRNADDADRAVTALTSAGFSPNEINVMARDEAVRTRISGTAANAIDVGTGAARGGAVVGGLGGLLVGLGLLAIPGVGPILASGSIAAAIGSTVAGAGLGAATGGVLGALVGLGIPEDHAEVYAEGVKRGGVLVAVDTDDESRLTNAQSLLSSNGALDSQKSQQEWRQSGWKGFDPTVEPTQDYPRL